MHRYYDIPRHPPLPYLHVSCPHEYSLFTPQNVRDAIGPLQLGKAHDHDESVGKNFICGHLAPLLPHTFTRTVCEGFPTSWTEHTIVPTFKSKDPMMWDNYRAIIIGHYWAMLYASILELELSEWVENHGHRAQGRALLRRGPLL